jgi:hypothetical protein
MAKVKTLYGATGEDGSTGDSVDRMNPALNKGDGARIDSDGKERIGSQGKAERVDDGSPPDPLGKAKSMYEDSTQFIESSLRHRWERSERSFQNRHQAGSKYFSEQYKTKSKLYRPKTRSMLRGAEASAAASFFSNIDPVNVQALNQGDPEQRASAAIKKELLKYRLTTPNQRVAIPWFLTVIGAMQDAHKYGIVASKQYWEYETVEYKTKVTYSDDSVEEKSETVIVRDKPCVDIIPPENIRIDRAADWRDPINSSPFVIVMHPMYMYEVLEKMERPDEITGEKWLDVGRESLAKASTREAWDSTRQNREGNREDSKESQIEIDEYQIVWVHENVAKWDGIDWVWYTSGTFNLLSKPRPLQTVYPHLHDGERPFIMGSCLVETNRLYPSSKIDLTAGLQAEANEIVNQRLDNVKLALNKRYFTKRGSQVDLRSLLRNTAGSVTMMNDTEQDVKVVETKDVTSSSYQEQDRINVDFDEVAGQFSAGTVQTNRRMNETVGGMEMLAGSSNNVAELDLRVFSETWVQPVLQQLVRMESYYENDKTILALAAENAKVLQKYGQSEVTDELLDMDVLVRVNVGIGATDPNTKLQRFMTAAQALGQVIGEEIKPMLNMEEVIKEVMGAMGYQDGDRFFNFGEELPEVAILKQQMEQLQQQLQQALDDGQVKRDVATIGAESRVLAQIIDSEARQQMRAEDAQGDYATQDLRGQQQLEQSLVEAMVDRSEAEQQRGLEIFKERLHAETEEKKIEAAKQKAQSTGAKKPNGKSG